MVVIRVPVHFLWSSSDLVSILLSSSYVSHADVIVDMGQVLSRPDRTVWREVAENKGQRRQGSGRVHKGDLHKNVLRNPIVC